MIIADRITVPDGTQAILWDMDGVLIDSLQLDYVVCNKLLSQFFDPSCSVSREFIRSIFAYAPPDFWKIIFDHVKKKYGIDGEFPHFDEILDKYHDARNNNRFDLNPGIKEILDGIRNSDLKTAVVSNNLTKDVEKVLRLAGIAEYFDCIVGNDIRSLQKKPAPDTYLFAAEQIGVPPDRCAVVEDSLVGAQAGRSAGAFTIGVATGANDFDALSRSENTDRVYLSFEPVRGIFEKGDVTRKIIRTPNDFISHMVEHIAWRTGVSVELAWFSDDWNDLGVFIGKQIRKFGLEKPVSAAMGMIDDGSAEVTVDTQTSPDLSFSGITNLDLPWFLSLRCEQLDSGTPLIELLKGLASGVGAKIGVRVWGMEDPHHTWEGVFRSLGIALNDIIFPKIESSTFDSKKVESNSAAGDIQVRSRSAMGANVIRKTAESSVSVNIDFSGEMHHGFHFRTSPSIHVTGLDNLLKELADNAGFRVNVDFVAEVLSSSHVVAEDTGLVLGRALREILVTRMRTHGVNGAGGSVSSPEDLETDPIRVAVSVEGRKFIKFVPDGFSYKELRRDFLVGHDVTGGLFSEDLDDFLDGLAGGLGCGIVIHMARPVEPDTGWRSIFQNLGKAIRQAFSINPYRKGVPPGVKATLS